MFLQKISAEITREQESQVTTLIDNAMSILSFLVSLNSIIRLRLAKLSRGHVDFVDTSLVELRANPAHKPGYYTLEEFVKDVELKNSLHRIRAELASFAEKINDTILLVEAEAYKKARLFYAAVKAAAGAGAEDAERIAKKLAYHYKKQGQHKTTGNGSGQEQNETVLKGKEKEIEN